MFIPQIFSFVGINEDCHQEWLNNFFQIFVVPNSENLTELYCTYQTLTYLTARPKSAEHGTMAAGRTPPWASGMEAVKPAAPEPC